MVSILHAETLTLNTLTFIMKSEKCGCQHCNQTVAQALAAFPKWMNRPIARVQVFTVHLARKMFGLDLPYEFFWNAQTRRELKPRLAMFMRHEVAAMLRVNRRNKA